MEQSYTELNGTGVNGTEVNGAGVNGNYILIWFVSNMFIILFQFLAMLTSS